MFILADTPLSDRWLQILSIELLIDILAIPDIIIVTSASISAISIFSGQTNIRGIINICELVYLIVHIPSSGALLFHYLNILKLLV
jgi:hypothetical protein